MVLRTKQGQETERHLRIKTLEVIDGGDEISADSWRDEIEKRMRGDTTAAQDKERDRLRAVCKVEISAVMAMTPEQRSTYDPTADSIWAAPAEDA